MMAVNEEFQFYLERAFEPLGHVTTKKMFGGLGIFKHGLMFALYSSKGVLAFKADGLNRSDFEAQGCAEWKPERKGSESASMGYWEAPDWLMDDEEHLVTWGKRAFDAALRIDQDKPLSKRKLRF